MPSTQSPRGLFSLFFRVRGGRANVVVKARPQDLWIENHKEGTGKEKSTSVQVVHLLRGHLRRPSKYHSQEALPILYAHGRKVEASLVMRPRERAQGRVSCLPKTRKIPPPRGVVDNINAKIITHQRSTLGLGDFMETDRKRKVSALIDEVNSAQSPGEQQRMPASSEQHQTATPHRKRTTAQVDLSEEKWAYKLRLRAHTERCEDSGKGRYWCEAFICFRNKTIATAPTSAPAQTLSNVPSYSAYTAIPIQFSLDVDARNLVEMITKNPRGLSVSLDTKNKSVFVDAAQCGERR